jgi:hypothetical protein
MTVWISEHVGYKGSQAGMTQSPLVSYNVSTGAAGPFPQAGTKYVRVTCDSGVLFNNSTTSTGLALTSTNSVRVPANITPELISVSTGFRIQVLST